MPDINWNGDAESAPFKSRFDDESENLILAETDTGTALFEWDGTAWQFRGPVEMNGEDVSGIGSLTATSGNFDSVTTEEATTRSQNAHRVNADWFEGSDQSQIEAAFDFAVANDIPVVELAGGDYTIESGSLDIPDNIRLSGTTADDDKGTRLLGQEDGPESMITLGRASVLENVRLQSSSSAEYVNSVEITGDFAARVRHCWFQAADDVLISDGERHIISTNAFDNTDITFATDTSDCGGAGNVNVGTITDNGSNPDFGDGV